MSKWSAAFRDSRWQKLRLEVMGRDDFTCHCCGATGEGVTLNVHHSYYESGKAPWEYDIRTLFTLCENCHTTIHENQKKLLANIISATCQTAAPGDIYNTLNGFIDAKYHGPSFENTSAYNIGYAHGRIEINKIDANAISMANNANNIGASNE